MELDQDVLVVRDDIIASREADWFAVIYRQVGVLGCSQTDERCRGPGVDQHVAGFNTRLVGEQEACHLEAIALECVRERFDTPGQLDVC